MQNSQTATEFSAFVSSYKNTIYDRIQAYLPNSESETFNKIVREYVDRKGQYRRPAYILLWALLYGGDAQQAILPAAAQQASEDWILMHDDWFDSNTLRRGKPTAHLIYGAEYAINGGDALHTIMWRMAMDAAVRLDGEKAKKYLNKFYDIMLTTCVGQHMDMSLTNENLDITKFTMEDYYKAIQAKSAYYSVYGPMQVGGIIANAETERIEGIKQYGIPAGLAFQIKDDILDCTSTEGELGKAIGTDVREGVKTIILWHAVHSASSSMLRRLKQIYAKPRGSKGEEEIKFVISAFEELGSIHFAEREAERLAKDALRNFELMERDVKESKIKEIARQSISCVVSRGK
jgi:geranylgeranyl pyrophosphate synthase